MCGGHFKDFYLKKVTIQNPDVIFTHLNVERK